MKRKYNVGDIYVNNQGESFKIINYIDSKHVEIEFLDSHFKKLVSSGNITKKALKEIRQGCKIIQTVCIYDGGKDPNVTSLYKYYK